MAACVFCKHIWWIGINKKYWHFLLLPTDVFLFLLLSESTNTTWEKSWRWRIHHGLRLLRTSLAFDRLATVIVNSTCQVSPQMPCTLDIHQLWPGAGQKHQITCKQGKHKNQDLVITYDTHLMTLAASQNGSKTIPLFVKRLWEHSQNNTLYHLWNMLIIWIHFVFVCNYFASKPTAFNEKTGLSSALTKWIKEKVEILIHRIVFVLL